MSKHKSLIKNVSITQAGRAHSASHDSKCRFAKGDFRLTVKEDRDESHYPLEVGAVFIEEAIAKLERLLVSVKERQGGAASVNRP